MPWTRRAGSTSSPLQQAGVGSFAVLLVTVVLIIGLLGLVGLPRGSEGSGAVMHIVITLLALIVLFAAVRIARASLQKQRWLGTILAGVLVVTIGGYMLTSSTVLGKAVSILWVILVITTPWVILREVLSSRRVTAQTLMGAVTVYLLIAVSLAFVAVAMDSSIGFFETSPRPTAFVYFAFVTITTLGYGDLAPYTDGARMASVSAAVVAQMYLVIVVARLVTIWSPSRKPELPEEPT